MRRRWEAYSGGMPHSHNYSISAPTVAIEQHRHNSSTTRVNVPAGSRVALPVPRTKAHPNAAIRNPLRGCERGTTAGRYGSPLADDILSTICSKNLSEEIAYAQGKNGGCKRLLLGKANKRLNLSVRPATGDTFASRIVNDARCGARGTCVCLAHEITFGFGCTSQPTYAWKGPAAARPSLAIIRRRGRNSCLQRPNLTRSYRGRI